MKSVFFLCASLLLIPILTFAQNEDIKGEELSVLRNTNNGTQTTMLRYDTRDQNVKGHPFLTDDWAAGWVLSVNKKKYENVLLRFDVIENVLYFKDKKEEIQILDSEQVVKFGFGGNGSTLIELSKELTPKGEAFFQILHANSKTKLMMRFGKKFFAAPKANDGYTTSKSARYEIANELWIQVRGDSYKVKRTANSIAAVFGDRKTEVKTFIKKYKIDLDKDTEIARILEFYATL